MDGGIRYRKCSHGWRVSVQSPPSLIVSKQRTYSKGLEAWMPEVIFTKERG